MTSAALPNGLIGHTGFVGGNLAGQARFDEFYNSQNIESIAGRSFDLLVCSGMPAVKWLANREPQADRAALDRLIGCLRQTSARQIVIISTIDVYPQPVGVDEDTPIDISAQQPYGRHRLLLEQAAADHFPAALSVRLPALFGPGLKKNALYDLLHDNETHRIHSAGQFPFYNLAHLWADIRTSLAANLTRVNFATEPVTIRELACEALDIDFQNELPTAPPRYDIRSKHATLFAGQRGYLYSRRQVLDEMRAFAIAERARLTGKARP